MREETERFFAAVVAEDRSVLDFLEADFTFVNERLARHYGIADVTGSEFRRVQLSGKERGGLLTQASILTLTSNPTRTSPVRRGKWILENLLGATVPPPPQNVPPLPETPATVAGGSLRQRLEQHRSKTECATCHARMDSHRPWTGKLRCPGCLADHGRRDADRCVGQSGGPGVCQPCRVQRTIACQAGAIHSLPGRKTAHLCVGPGRGKL